MALGGWRAVAPAGLCVEGCDLGSGGSLPVERPDPLQLPPLAVRVYFKEAQGKRPGFDIAVRKAIANLSSVHLSLGFRNHFVHQAVHFVFPFVVGFIAPVHSI